LHTTSIGNVQVEKNLSAVQTIYNLDADYKLIAKTDEEGNPVVDSIFNDDGMLDIENCQGYTAEQQAKELMLSF
jgi:hypothetical protein